MIKDAKDKTKGGGKFDFANFMKEELPKIEGMIPKEMKDKLQGLLKGDGAKDIMGGLKKMVQGKKGGEEGMKKLGDFFKGMKGGAGSR
jgi:hypothetical protein